MTMMKTTLLTLIAAVGTASAERVPCQTSTRDGYTFVCTYGESGNYSQINLELGALSDDLEHAHLCGPTSAAAALDQLLDRTNSVSGTWIATSFEPKSRATRIINVAGKVFWNPTLFAGTTEAGMDWFQNSAKDIDPNYVGAKDHASAGLFESPTLLTDTYFRTHLLQGSAMVLHRTKYEETCTTDWFGNKQCSYSDQVENHHYMAVNGTLTNDAGTFMTRIWQPHAGHTPAFGLVAAEQIRDFRQMPIVGTDDHRPFGSYTVFYEKVDGTHDQYTVVDRVHRIETH